MKLKDMTVHEMVDFAIQSPELFQEAAEELQRDNIKELCQGDGQCEWRLQGFLFRLESEAEHYKDPIARLNFVIERFYKHIQDNYGGYHD